MSKKTTPKASSYSQPTQPVNNNNNKAAPKHADSEKSSAPKIPHNAFIPLNNNNHNNHVPSNSDTVSDWLATSQDFEKPPTPAPVADPLALPERRCREYWLEISQDLDVRLKARSEGSKAPINLGSNRVYARPVFDRRFELDFLKIEKEKLTPRDQRNTGIDVVITRSPVTMGPPTKVGSERKKAIEASISEFKEKLEKRKLGPRMHEQLGEVKESKAEETVKVATKQLEAAKSKKADDAVRVKEEEEELEIVESKGTDDAGRVKEKKKHFEVAESKKADDAVRAKEKEEQLEAAETKKANDAVRAKQIEKQFEVAESKKADDAGRAKDKKEQFEAAESKKTDEAVTVRAKAKEACCGRDREAQGRAGAEEVR